MAYRAVDRFLFFWWNSGAFLHARGVLSLLCGLGIGSIGVLWVVFVGNMVF